MITPLYAFTKSTGLIAGPPITKAKANDIRGLPIRTSPNFTGSNNKKKRQPWRRSTASCIRCHNTVNEKRLLQGSMHRRQLLLASTSLPLKPQQIMGAMPPSLSLTDYHKLANAVHEAEKINKTSLSDGVCWVGSSEPLKPRNSKSLDELSGVIAVPRADQEVAKETEVVTARIIRRAAAFKRMMEKEEQLVLQGIEITNNKPLCFHVYISCLGQQFEAEEEEYVGTFSHMPPPRKQVGHHNNKPDFDDDRHEQKRVLKRCCLRLGINGIFIQRHNLNAYQEETVIVKLVPTLKLDGDPIKVESIFIDYT